MRMGIKEFRDRLGEVARGSEPVQLTDRGLVIGTYTPLPRMTDEHRVRARRALADLAGVRQGLERRGIDTESMMADVGLDPWGVPLPHDR